MIQQVFSNLDEATAILLIIFRNFTKFEYTFYSPKVKQNLISSTRNIIYELPFELPDDLRLKK